MQNGTSHFETTNYDQLEAQLAIHGVDVDASQVHGITCGLLCANTRMTASLWPRLLLDPANAEEQGSAMLSVQLERSLNELFEQTRRTLESTEYEFEILIPADGAPQSERSDGIGEWCQGFVMGFYADGQQQPESLPGDAGEILRDIIEIAGADIDIGDMDANETEHALMELEEYLRVGAQLVFEEINAPDAENADGSTDDRPALH